MSERHDQSHYIYLIQPTFIFQTPLFKLYSVLQLGLTGSNLEEGCPLQFTKITHRAQAVLDQDLFVQNMSHT